MLPWTGMPMIVAPIAGILSDRIGGRPVVAAGLALQAVGPRAGCAVRRRTRRVLRRPAARPDHQRHRHGPVLRPRRQPGHVQRPPRASRASPPAPTTRCARSAARSASRCSASIFSAQGGYESAQRLRRRPAARAGDGRRGRGGRRGRRPADSCPAARGRGRAGGRRGTGTRAGDGVPLRRSGVPPTPRSGPLTSAIWRGSPLRPGTRAYGPVHPGGAVRARAPRRAGGRGAVSGVRHERVQELHDAPLAPLTTFRLGGPPPGWSPPPPTPRSSPPSARPTPGHAAAADRRRQQPRHRRQGLRRHRAAHRHQGLRPRRHPLELAAGEVWTDAVARTVDAGLAGIECLAGIPGSAGATPIQNVGAYGQEVSSTITEVIAYDRTTARDGHPHQRRVRLLLPAQPLQGRPGPLRRPARPLRPGGRRRPSAPLKYAETARALGVEPGSGCRWRGPRDRAEAARGQGHGPGPRATTTPGRPAPSSPTPSSPPPSSPRSTRACATASATTRSRPPTPRARGARRPPRPG